MGIHAYSERGSEKERITICCHDRNFRKHKERTKTSPSYLVCDQLQFNVKRRVVAVEKKRKQVQWEAPRGSQGASRGALSRCQNKPTWCNAHSPADVTTTTTTAASSPPPWKCESIPLPFPLFGVHWSVLCGFLVGKESCGRFKGHCLGTYCWV